MDAPDDEPPRLIPIGEAARLLGVSIDTVRRWEAEGRIVSTRTVGAHRRYNLADIERLGRPA